MTSTSIPTCSSDPESRACAGPESNPRSGSTLLVVLIIASIVGGWIVFGLSDSQLVWSEVADRVESDQALFRALGELEVARDLLIHAPMGKTGVNSLLERALDGEGTIPPTRVRVVPIEGVIDWYLLEARVPHRRGELRIREVMRANGSLCQTAYVAIKPGETLADERIWGFDLLRHEVLPEFHVPADREVELALYRVGSEQWIRIREFARTAESERAGSGRIVRRERLAPVFRPQVRTVRSPVYRTASKARTLPRFDLEPISRRFDEKTWITADGDAPGYWTWTEREEVVLTPVRRGFYREDFSVPVVDRYREVERTIAKFSHYQSITEDVWIETPASNPATISPGGTSRLLAERRLRAPENGLVLIEGPIRSVSGEVVDRLTIATNDQVQIRGCLQYVDSDGDLAYQNGTDPSRPYRPNPAYQGRAALGIVARKNVVVTNDVPPHLELNGALVSLAGSVTIEGVVRDAAGRVTEINRCAEGVGTVAGRAFSKPSLRRLGSVAAAHGAIDSITEGGRVRSGFTRGTSRFDPNLRLAPPPFFPLERHPSFLARQVVR